jgi:REP element-mobilizing transposase RayT
MGRAHAVRPYIAMTDRPQRHSIRLPTYDYRTAGGYFITICTFQREPVLAQIVDDAPRLTALGKIVREEWLRTGTMRQEIALDEFVIMPNHFHTLFFIHDTVGAHGVRPYCMNQVGAHRVRPLSTKRISVVSLQFWKDLGMGSRIR